MRGRSPHAHLGPLLHSIVPLHRYGASDRNGRERPGSRGRHFFRRPDEFQEDQGSIGADTSTSPQAAAKGDLMTAPMNRMPLISTRQPTTSLATKSSRRALLSLLPLALL